MLMVESLGVMDVPSKIYVFFHYLQNDIEDYTKHIKFMFLFKFFKTYQ